MGYFLGVPYLSCDPTQDRLVGAHRQGWLGQRLQDRQWKPSTAHLGEDDWGAKPPESSRWRHCQGVEEGRRGRALPWMLAFCLALLGVPACLPGLA